MSKKLIINLKAGSFILFGLTLLVSYLVVIGNYQSLFSSSNKYTITLDNSQGLFKGSSVTINGLKVGSVYYIELQSTRVLVHLQIKKNFSTMVNQSSTASLQTEGMLGDKYIAIHTSDDSAPAIPTGSSIQTKDSKNISNLLIGEGALVENISKFFKEAATLVESLNTKEDKGNLAENLKNVSQGAEKIFSKENSQEVKAILRHTKSILRKIDKGEGSLGAVVNDRSLHDKALTFLGGKPYKVFLKSIFNKRNSSLEEE